MTEQTLRELVDQLGTVRVLIVRRADGRFTYRCQEKVDGEWGPETVDAGVYDSIDTAETGAPARALAQIPVSLKHRAEKREPVFRKDDATTRRIESSMRLRAVACC